MSDNHTAMLEILSKRLADEGKLIEAGWVSMQLMALPPDAPQIQIDDMRLAFMCGAQHLFASLMSVMDPGEEPTDADMERMGLIHRELNDFGKELELRFSRPRGSA